MGSGGRRRKTELLFHEGRERKHRPGIHLESFFLCIASRQTPMPSMPSLLQNRVKRGGEKEAFESPRPLAFSLAGCCQRLAPFVTLVTTLVSRD